MLTPIDVVLANQWEQLFPEPLPINHAYIRKNGKIEPPTLPIERYGNTYSLREDIANYSITIEKSGIIVEGNGYMLSLPAYGETSEYGVVRGAPGLITIKNASNVTVRNFVFQKCSTGISVYDSSEIDILQNTIVSTCGIYLSNSHNCNIERNSINCTSSSILFSFVSSLDIRFNTLTYVGSPHMGYGISEYFYNSTIVGNVFSNFFIAIYHVCKFNQIVWNSFENNERAIILMYGNNEIHHNNFINNGDNFSFDSGYNSLDDGTEGNYWSNYNGTDTDGDGIGDTPYVISSFMITNEDTNRDNYPLMTLVDINTIPEFPSELILGFILVGSLAIVLFKKKVWKEFS